jgi:hypothetical protein
VYNPEFNDSTPFKMDKILINPKLGTCLYSFINFYEHDKDKRRKSHEKKIKTKAIIKLLSHPSQV